MTTRTQYIDKMKNQLDHINASMDRLSEQAAGAQTTLRLNYHKDMAHLRQQASHARDKMDDLRTASEDGWDAMVMEMEKVRDAFVHSYRDFKSRI
jgi:hypothetical protein